MPSTTVAMMPKSPRLTCKIDGRTAAGRRRRDLITAFTAALASGGTINAIKQAAIFRAAELMATAEHLRHRALTGEAVDMTALIKLENVAGRALRELSAIDRGHHPKRETFEFDLSALKLSEDEMEL